MTNEELRRFNHTYWNENADQWFGTTALPEYGVKFPTEDELHLFGDVSGKRLLEICCGSGHSLKYHADRNAAELWGVDFSERQLENAEAYLRENGYTAKLICSPMEAELPLPKEYFDYVYSIYGIGWTTDLEGTFRQIASCLKKDGIFIFSWHHTLFYCVSPSCESWWDPTGRRQVTQNEQLIVSRSYFDESEFTMPVDGSRIILRNRKISTYINALAKAGFAVEQMIEQNDQSALNDESVKSKQGAMIPLSVAFKARKL